MGPVRADAGADAHDAGAYSGADDGRAYLDARADAAADARAYPGDGAAYAGDCRADAGADAHDAGAYASLTAHAV